MKKVKKFILFVCVVFLAFLAGIGIAEIKIQKDKAKIVKDDTLTTDNIVRETEDKGEVNPGDPIDVIKKMESGAKQEESRNVSIEKKTYFEEKDQNIDDNTPEEDTGDIIEDPEMED